MSKILSQKTISSLVKMSREYYEKAYAPYSKYKVGAAVLTESEELFPGCNVENALYPLCTCAERTAICTAVAQGHRVIHAVAICAGGDETGWPAPCGSCCQNLIEFEDSEFPDINVILVKPSTGEYDLKTLSYFYANPFSKRNLPK